MFLGFFSVPVQVPFVAFQTAAGKNCFNAERSHGAWAEVTVNGAELASSLALIRAHSGMSGSGDV